MAKSSKIVGLSVLVIFTLSLATIILTKPLPTQAANICQFPRNLAIGSNGADVRLLQQFLNESPDTRVAASGSGSPGHESIFFGPATKSAVIRYQNKYVAQVLVPFGLKKGTGYFGPSTRRFINTTCVNTPSVSTNGVGATSGSSGLSASSQLVYTGAPSITFNSIIINSIQVDNTVSFTVRALQPVNHKLTYSLLDPPVNSYFNPVDGTFYWTPIDAQAGQYDLNFEAVDDVTGEIAKFTKSINVSLTPVLATDQVPVTIAQASTSSITTVPISNTASTGYTPLVNYSTTPIYSWAPAGSYLSNISQFVWLSQDSLKNIDAIRSQLLAKPAGQRVVFTWDLANDLGQDPSDDCPRGIPSSIQCIWWDNGVATTSAIISSAFSKLSAAGVPIDLLISDYEKDLSNWNLSSNQYPAILADPRFPAILGQLSSLGWPAGDTLDGSGNFKSVSDRDIWNELMYERVASYLNQGIFDPARRYYPNLDGANYNYAYHSSQYAVPDPNNVQTFKYGQGAVFGTEQSPVLYGYINGISNSVQAGNQPYGSSPFAAFKYNVNVLRSAKLSSGVPVLPWFSYKSFTSDYLANSDLYQEMIFHTLLSGVKGLLFWNPPENNQATASDNQIMSYAAQEFDSVAGFSGAQTVVNQIIPWGSDYVLSGMKNGSQVIWRFTPDLTGGKTLASTLVSQSNNQVVVKTASAQLTFPNAKIVSGIRTTSSQGYWIAQTGSPQVNGGMAMTPESAFGQTASVVNATNAEPWQAGLPGIILAYFLLMLLAI